jgi:hypothetical protein
MEVYLEWLGGKPLFKERGMSGTIIKWTSGMGHRPSAHMTSYGSSYIPERRKHQGASNNLSENILPFIYCSSPSQVYLFVLVLPFFTALISLPLRSCISAT